jgi:hypothetical protein
MYEHISVLSATNKKRVQFDPSNDEHLTELKFFMKHNKWKTGCPFLLEEPFEDIPTLCVRKYLDYSLGI